MNEAEADSRRSRRCHALRVWQAICNTLQGIACVSVGVAVARGNDKKIRAIYLACGWGEP